jgi:hypothetical protein
MAGHYGAERVTVQNLRVFAVHPEDNLLLVQGAVPGPRGGLGRCLNWQACRWSRRIARRLGRLKCGPMCFRLRCALISCTAWFGCS